MSNNINVIKNRYEFVILFDVKNGNPNGDPDAGNMPRIDSESGYGLVTDVCLKRKIRNYIDTKMEDAQGDYSKGYRIYIKNDKSLNEKDEEAYEYIGVKSGSDIKKEKKNDTALEIKDFMCKNFFDIRTFGAVMTTFVSSKLNCGQVRGPVQIGFARSIDPVISQEITLTRVAITTKENSEEKQTEMGNKYIIPYALYKAEGYISANLAKKVTGFSEDDLELLWEAILNMFEHDHSAARGNMAVRELIIFKHDSELGNCQAHKLFDRIEVNKKEGIVYPRQYEDYEVKVFGIDIKNHADAESKINERTPDGVTVELKL